MIIYAHGIQLDTKVIKKMEVHESRSLVVIRYSRYNRDDLGELKLSFKKRDEARLFFEKVRSAFKEMQTEINVKEYSLYVEEYHYEKYVDEELKITGGTASYDFANN